MIHFPWSTLLCAAWGVAVSMQGARAPQAAAGARAGAPKACAQCPSLALVCAAQAEYPVRVRCYTSTPEHSEGGFSSRHNYGHFNERNDPARNWEALDFRLPRL